MNFAVRSAYVDSRSFSRNLHCDDCVRALRALGFSLKWTTPIRVVLCRDDHWAYIPRHGRISDAEAVAILATASVELEDFDRALAGIEAMQPRPSNELVRRAGGGEALRARAAYPGFKA